MTKQVVTVTLDADLVELAKGRQWKLSTKLNELLKAELSGEPAQSVPAWLIDKASGARYQVTDRGLMFPNAAESQKYESVRARRGKTFGELQDEKKADAAGDLVERSDNSASGEASSE